MLKLVRIEVFFASSSYKRTFLNWLLLVFKILGQAQLSDDSRLRWGSPPCASASRRPLRVFPMNQALPCPTHAHTHPDGRAEAHRESRSRPALGPSCSAGPALISAAPALRRGAGHCLSAQPWAAGRVSEPRFQNPGSGSPCTCRN